jgi:hypothetical protein
MLCIVNAALIGADDLGYSSWTSALRASRLLGLIANTLERQYFFLSISSTHIDNQSQALSLLGSCYNPSQNSHCGSFVARFDTLDCGI